MISTNIAKEEIKLDLYDSMTFTDAFTYTTVSDTSVTIETKRGVLMICPESINRSFSDLDKIPDGGACFFCKGFGLDVTELKEYIVYDLELEYIRDDTSVQRSRKSSNMICHECFYKLCSEIRDSSELISQVI